MTRPARIPTRIKWGLNDILMEQATIRRQIDTLRPAITQRNDPSLLRAWASLVESLAEIERKARNASLGIYEE